jgi:hypothetical protein
VFRDAPLLLTGGKSGQELKKLGRVKAAVYSAKGASSASEHMLSYIAASRLQDAVKVCQNWDFGKKNAKSFWNKYKVSCYAKFLKCTNTALYYEFCTRYHGFYLF